MSASQEQRRRRARQRAVDEQCRPITLPPTPGGQSRWLGASTHRPGHAYKVTGAPGGGTPVTCGCPAGAWGLPCCHAAAVELLLHPDLAPQPTTSRASPPRGGGVPGQLGRRRGRPGRLSLARAGEGRIGRAHGVDPYHERRE